MIRLLRQWLATMRNDPLADQLMRDAATSQPGFCRGLHDKTMRSIRVETPMLRTHAPGSSRESAAPYWSTVAVAVCLLLVGYKLLSEQFYVSNSIQNL